MIKEINGLNFVIGSGVSANDLAFHFKNVLNGRMDLKYLYAEPLFTDVILDSEITLAEVQTVIFKAKNGKAPGEDGIPYEYFKNATPSFIF